jgi:lipooligosaccharide transport system ATP-binding protein
VLELTIEESCPPQQLLASLDGRFESYELAERQLLLYGDDAESILEALDHDRFPCERAVVRRASLEDVFLRLTGRSLRD